MTVIDARAGVWARPSLEDAAGAPALDYEYELPRHLHKRGEAESLIVRTPAECVAALARGWEIHLAGPLELDEDEDVAPAGPAPMIGASGVTATTVAPNVAPARPVKAAKPAKPAKRKAGK